MDALVVDVGGGIGTASLALAKEFSNIKIVIQDRPPVVENGIEVCLLYRLAVYGYSSYRRSGRKNYQTLYHLAAFSSKVNVLQNNDHRHLTRKYSARLLH